MSRCRPSATKLNLFKRGWLGHGFADLISSVIASQVEGLEEEDGCVCVCVLGGGGGDIERGRRGQTERDGEGRRRVKKKKKRVLEQLYTTWIAFQKKSRRPQFSL